MQLTNDKIWVGNLGEAAALNLLGFEVVGLRINPNNTQRRQTQFGFAKVAELVSSPDSVGIIDEYWGGKIQVDAMAFYNAINSLRKQRREFEETLPPLNDNLTNLRN